VLYLPDETGGGSSEATVMLNVSLRLLELGVWVYKLNMAQAREDVYVTGVDWDWFSDGISV
jgi:hypothetical protein